MLSPSLGSLLSMHSSLLVALLPRLHCQFKFGFLCAFHAAFDFRLSSNRLRWLLPPARTPPPHAGSPFGSCLISIIWRVSSSARGLCQGRARQVKTNLTHTRNHTPTHWDFGRKLFDFQLNFESTTEETCHHQQQQQRASFCDTRQLHFEIRFFPPFFSFHFWFVWEGESWQLSSWTEITWISKGTHGNELLPSDPTATPSPLSLGSEAEAVATCSFIHDWGILRDRERETDREKELSVMPKVLPLIDNRQLHQLLFAFHFSQWSQFPNAFPPLLNKAFWDSILLRNGARISRKKQSTWIWRGYK